MTPIKKALAKICQIAMYRKKKGQKTEGKLIVCQILWFYVGQSVY